MTPAIAALATAGGTSAETIAAAPTEGFRLRRVDLGSTAAADREEIRGLVRRSALADRSLRAGARTIVDDVRSRGADAVRAASARFGGGAGDGRLVIGRSELDAAAERLPRAVRAALEAAATAVEAVAFDALPRTVRTATAPGVEVERRWTATRRVGAYVPGGSASYPSSVVMTVVPARVAGVEEVVLATPAHANGEVDAVVLGAAGLLGVDAVLVAGGAQAIAALAFGLDDEGFERVDLIVGPGNAWVTAAKLEVAADVAIDLPAGPSEGVVLADAAADAVTVAADLMTQAEHGPDSPALLVTTSADLADRVEEEVGRRLATAIRVDVLERSLAAHGRIVLAPSLAEAVAFVNAYAPEHLSVDVEPLEQTVSAVRNAGSIFVGRWAPESAGDYATGANHVLPTGGLARGRGPLGVETFGRFVQVQRISEEGLARLRSTIVELAAAEGLDAHAAAVESRFPAESTTAGESSADPTVVAGPGTDRR